MSEFDKKKIIYHIVFCTNKNAAIHVVQQGETRESPAAPCRNVLKNGEKSQWSLLWW